MDFAQRHIGPDGDGTQAMLAAVGYASLDDLTEAACSGVTCLAQELPGTWDIEFRRDAVRVPGHRGSEQPARRGRHGS